MLDKGIFSQDDDSELMSILDIVRKCKGGRNNCVYNLMNGCYN